MNLAAIVENKEAANFSIDSVDWCESSRERVQIDDGCRSMEEENGDDERHIV
jgi:hypothetical protein